ncbi:MAG: Rieske 2Fe-2S domain-containing protein [Acidimicrobiia bacterium]|nr:Rieske 2Fe-2S domain-containing protein [Acidimicrobiia bacterium]
MRGLGRREFLTRGWQIAAGLMGVAGGWTSWDVLRARAEGGLGGVIKAMRDADVTAETVVFVREAQSYLTRNGDVVVALWQRCPHLGCRVSWCESSGEFECPCHGSAFNRLGEVRSGPSPTGMQQFSVEVTDGEVFVDTGQVIAGKDPGDETIDEPKRGPSCSGEA